MILSYSIKYVNISVACGNNQVSPLFMNHRKIHLNFMDLSGFFLKILCLSVLLHYV